MNMPVLILLTIGILLIWSAIKDKNPLESIKSVFQT